MGTSGEGTFRCLVAVRARLSPFYEVEDVVEHVERYVKEQISSRFVWLWVLRSSMRSWEIFRRTTEDRKRELIYI